MIFFTAVGLVFVGVCAVIGFAVIVVAIARGDS
jgi:hypothetical protein